MPLQKRQQWGELAVHFFDALKDGDKAAFSLDVIWSTDFNDLKCPAYIFEGLAWLEARLRRKQVDILPEQVKLGEPK
ncbi:hypothetical protein [Glaciimonas soli]|uniref:hypothetical protein n=1 Tax=Glaciimonas soli TaxID=2590999 RepID=UPI001D173040|nr:hypothetical protein [Glaciimonas soli]